MVSNFASIRAVVFDAVGTLIHPNPPAAAVYYEVGRRHGSRLTQDVVARNFVSALKRHDLMLAHVANWKLTNERGRGSIAG